ncbi:sensor histidine kinase [Acrocarpospora macrocephala]|nr:histidine kinase [Acrocarpospora macrocephala]
MAIPRVMRSASVAVLVAVVDAAVVFPGWDGWPSAAQVVAIAVVAGLAAWLPVVALLAALVLAVPGGANALLVWTGYQVGRQVVSRSGIVVAAVGSVGCLGVQLFVLSAPPGPVVSRYVIFVALPVVLGRYLAQQRRLVSAREAQRRQSRREQALHERLRIARDVHDSLGHRLSLISIQAAALEVTELPAKQREAVLELAASARQALDDLHELVGTLRDRGMPESRSLGGIDGLAAEFRATGAPVTVLREGVPAALAPAAYRVVEEGLTNAAKHAPGQPVTVSLRAEGDTLLVTVRNPLPAEHRRNANGRTGHGLAGLDERVRLAGGMFHTASSDQEFRLVAMLPLTDAIEEAEPEVPASRRRLWVVALTLTAAAIVILAGPASMLGGLGG